MTVRKFYLSTFTVEVLSEGEPLKDPDLKTINYQITDGDCLGNVTYKGYSVLDGKEAADVSLNMGSDESFFQLTKDGEDSDDTL